MTRSHKYNDRDHRAESEGSPHQVFLPKYFGKNGFGGDPNRFKKNGGGKANWGNAGDEIQDQSGVNLYHTRRRSNGNILDLRDFNTKFDVNEPEPVFEEHLHGPNEKEAEAGGSELSKTETASSTTTSTTP